MTAYIIANIVRPLEDTWKINMDFLIDWLIDWSIELSKELSIWDVVQVHYKTYRCFSVTNRIDQEIGSLTYTSILLLTFLLSFDIVYKKSPYDYTKSHLIKSS